MSSFSDIGVFIQCGHTLVATVLLVIIGVPVNGTASERQFDNTRLWVEAGAATGLADSGQTRFCLSLGSTWYLTRSLGVGLGAGMSDIFEDAPVWGDAYKVRSYQVQTQLEVVAWYRDSISMFLSTAVGLAWWNSYHAFQGEIGSRVHTYRGLHLAFGLGARHRIPGSRVGMFAELQYLPEVGPALAWPLLKLALGIEG